MMWIPAGTRTKTFTERTMTFKPLVQHSRILQLNCEGLSAAKRSVISSIADKEKIDIICLQETHVDGDIAASPSLVST